MTNFHISKIKLPTILLNIKLVMAYCCEHKREFVCIYRVRNTNVLKEEINDKETKWPKDKL